MKLWSGCESCEVIDGLWFVCVGSVCVKRGKRESEQRPTYQQAIECPHVHAHTPRIAASEQASPKGEEQERGGPRCARLLQVGPFLLLSSCEPRPSGDAANGGARKLFQICKQKRDYVGKT